MTNRRTPFAWIAGFALCVLAAVAGCEGGTPATPARAPLGMLRPMAIFTPTPAPKVLYADHAGTLYQYRLPLSAHEKPFGALREAPDLTTIPQIAVGPYGNVAIATTTELRIFEPPIRSFARSRAKLIVPLTPAITEIGPSGADLVDIEYDPNNNLWLLNNLGGEVTELLAPLRKNSVAGPIVIFGAPGSKTAGYPALVQARFDVNANLYVLANSATGSNVFKLGFPYAKQPTGLGLNVAQAGFVDASQYDPTNPYPASVMLGQYLGPQTSPPPQQPPPPPIYQLAQFQLPFMPPPQGSVYPNALVPAVIGALVPDPMRATFYTLDASSGVLRAYPLPLPLTGTAKPTLTLRCPGPSTLCIAKSEHLFTAP